MGLEWAEPRPRLAPRAQRRPTPLCAQFRCWELGDHDGYCERHATARARTAALIAAAGRWRRS